ncbi:hypothetical protein GCM10027416_29520 [Okibacterium endophyticum]
MAQSLAHIDLERERLSADDALRQQPLSESLDLLEDAHSRYLAAAPADRKQLNNALLEHVLIGPSPEDIQVSLRSEITELRSNVRFLWRASGGRRLTCRRRRGPQPVTG